MHNLISMPNTLNLSELQSVIEKVTGSPITQESQKKAAAFKEAINFAKNRAQDSFYDEDGNGDAAIMRILPRDMKVSMAQAVFDEYQQCLIRNNGVDFGEIISLTYRLLRDNDDIRERYHKKFNYIHVDEYQDTNKAQLLLLDQLVGPHGMYIFLYICMYGFDRYTWF
jgi:DNA helicase-2/ATP-dependent DNA helicase PcrA